MASVMLSPPPNRFPIGATVEAYARTNWPAAQQRYPSGDPPGSAAASGTIGSDGSVTLTGLTEGVRYWLHTDVSGDDRYIAFTAQTGGSSSATDVEVVGPSPLPVDDDATQALLTRQGSLTDRSGTITAGGTSQEVMAANTSRKYLFVQNVSSGDLWIRFGSAAVATQPSIKLLPDASFVMEGFFVSTQALNVFGATTAQAYSAKEA